jgi:hypothetical protein
VDSANDVGCLEARGAASRGPAARRTADRVGKAAPLLRRLEDLTARVHTPVAADRVGKIANALCPQSDSSPRDFAHPTTGAFISFRSRAAAVALIWLCAFIYFGPERAEPFNVGQERPPDVLLIRCGEALHLSDGLFEGSDHDPNMPNRLYQAQSRESAG